MFQTFFVLRQCIRNLGGRWFCSTSPNPDRAVYYLNREISWLVRSGRITEARQLFDKTDLKNTVTWNSLITGYVKRREITEARKLFDDMPKRDVVSWNLMISGYLSSSFLEQGKELFDRMPERDLVSYNTMITGYFKNGMMKEALKLFDRMPLRDVVSWNAILTGFLDNGDVVRSIEFFFEMPDWDEASVCTIVSGLVRNGKLDEAARLLIECENDCSREVDLVHAYNTLIAGYGHNGRIDKAREVFENIPFGDVPGAGGHRRFKRNGVSWNTMIMCYVKVGDVLSARKLFDQMVQRDNFSWNTMISGYVRGLDMANALELFGEMPEPDTLTWNLMISGHAQLGDMDRALEFFERMPQKNLVSWNSIIAGYEKNKDYKGAIELFIMMQAEGERPDRHTISSLLGASTGVVDMLLGMQLHQVVTKAVIPDVPIYNALITMYSKCGAITEARILFDETKFQKEVITWNAMIAGYASHGYASEALKLFRLMKNFNVRATYITFISVLHACAHAGLVEEGRQTFKSMVSEYGIEPRIEHFASLVDVLGRQGRLEDAIDLINGMAFKPDKAVWGALLNASRVYNNFEMAWVAAKSLMRIDPGSSAPFVLLYNMYANAGQWDRASEIRTMMEKSNIQKQPAYSSVDSSLRL